MPEVTPALKTAEPARHANPTVKARALAYVIFERPHLDDSMRFLSDLGSLRRHGTGTSCICGERVRRRFVIS